MMSAALTIISGRLPGAGRTAGRGIVQIVRGDRAAGEDPERVKLRRLARGGDHGRLLSVGEVGAALRLGWQSAPGEDCYGDSGDGGGQKAGLVADNDRGIGNEARAGDR